jgi:hypothetical protein
LEQSQKHFRQAEAETTGGIAFAAPAQRLIARIKTILIFE